MSAFCRSRATCLLLSFLTLFFLVVHEACGQDAVRFDPLTFDTNGPSLSLNGQAGLNYVIETSIDMDLWTFLYSGVSTNGRLDLFQPLSTVTGQQFYRARAEAPPTTTLPILTSSLDTNASVSMLITPEGGVCTLYLQGTQQINLTFPANTAVDPFVLTMTLVTNLNGLPFGAGVLRAVRLDPPDFELLGAATLSFDFDPPTGFDRRQVVSFTSNPDGSSFHLVPDSVGTNSVKLSVIHGGLFGSCQATDQELTKAASALQRGAKAKSKQPAGPQMGAPSSDFYLSASQECFPERVDEAEKIRQDLKTALNNLSDSIARTIAQSRRSEPSDAKDDGTLPQDQIGLAGCLFYENNIKPLFPQVANNCSLLKVLAGAALGISRQLQLLGYDKCPDLLTLSDLPICAGAQACLAEIKECCSQLPADRQRFRLDLVSIIRQQELLGVTGQPGCFDLGDAEIEQLLKDCTDLLWNGSLTITEVGKYTEHPDQETVRTRERNTKFQGFVSEAFVINPTPPITLLLSVSGSTYYSDDTYTIITVDGCLLPDVRHERAAGTNSILVYLVLSGTGTNLTYELTMDTGQADLDVTSSFKNFVCVQGGRQLSDSQTATSPGGSLLPSLTGFQGKVVHSDTSDTIADEVKQDGQWDVVPSEITFQWDLSGNASP